MVGPKWFGMLNFAYFALFSIFSHQSSPKWFRTPNFGHFPPKWSKTIWSAYVNVNDPVIYMAIRCYTIEELHLLWVMFFLPIDHLKQIVFVVQHIAELQSTCSMYSHVNSSFVILSVEIHIDFLLYFIISYSLTSSLLSKLVSNSYFTKELKNSSAHKFQQLTLI